MKKLLLLSAAGVGYVLGAKAGRERYDQIMRIAGQVKDDPRVQAGAQQAADLAAEKAPIVKDKVAGAASAASEKVTGSSGPSGTGGSVRARAVAMPKVNPMTTTSPSASRRKARPGRDPAASRSSALMVTLRCHQPATPSAARAATLSSTRIP